MFIGFLRNLRIFFNFTSFYRIFGRSEFLLDFSKVYEFLTVFFKKIRCKITFFIRFELPYFLNILLNFSNMSFYRIIKKIYEFFHTFMGFFRNLCFLTDFFLKFDSVNFDFLSYQMWTIELFKNSENYELCRIYQKNR